MLKTLIAVSLVLSFVGFVHGQNGPKAEARMVRGAFAGGDDLHAIQEVALDLKAQVSGPGDRVAVRVCSKEKLPVALLTATASPFVLREHLEHYGIVAERILLLRSEDCVARDASLVLTEFWIVPKGAQPPAAVESIQSDRVQVELVRGGDTIKTAKDYGAALHELLERVTVRPEAVAVVVGSYHKRPSVVLANNLRKAKRTLLFGQGQASRVYIHSAPAGVVGEREPKYPDLFVFNAEPDAAQVPASCEAAAANLDFAVIETKKAPDTYVIIVARLGKNEPETLTRIRLAAAEEPLPALILPVVLLSGFPPQESRPFEPFRPAAPINCEDFQAMLDITIVEWAKNKEAHLILITRLGTGERDRKLSRARLTWVEDYLKRHDVKYLLAEGERVKGLGRFEAYVDGRLAMSVPVRKGSIKLCRGTNY